ncbi:MAG TPA: dehydrogenase, partial [Eubacteriaceae bacterium]|nr:dehydrogenase [Eubacteriaceae bacterium]
YPTHKTTHGWTVDAHMASLRNFFDNLHEGRILFEETPTFREAYLSQRLVALSYRSDDQNNTWQQV